LGTLRKQCLKAGIRVQDFWEMSLVEIFEAIQGFHELENERNENYLEGARLIAYWSAIGSHLDWKKARIKGPESIVPLPRDSKRRKERLKDWPSVVIEVTPKLNAEQSNG
jgi:hypothetical protein